MKRKPTEADYISAILHGDESMLKQMYHELFPMVYNLVTHNYAGSKEQAKDIFQNAVIIIYEKVKKSPDFRLSSKFSTFFYSICKNQWLKYNRKQKKEVYSGVANFDKMAAVAADDWEPEYGSLKWERGRLFNKAFAQMGEHCQELLHLFFEKMRMEEIAQRLGIRNAENARKQKERCQKKLIERIKDDPRYKELVM